MAIAALGAVLALPAGALGATASTDRACYNADGSDAVTVNGAGFEPGSVVNVLLDKKVATVLTAGADGTVSTKLPVPSPPQGGPTAHDRGYDLRLEQPSTNMAAATTFNAVDRIADYTPGNASTLGKVRFMAFGFAWNVAPGTAMPSIYLHYVDPRGKVKKTVSLGKAQGPCGALRTTKKMRVFPFVPRNGKWTLQFDGSKKYAKNAPGAVLLKLAI